MTLTRRDSLRVLGGGVAAAALWPRERLLAYAASKGVKFKVGVTDWNLKQEGKPAAVALAKQIGFDGVQVSIGKGTDSLPLADPALQQTYLAESKRVGLPLASLCLEVLHRNYLKSDPLGQRWVADAIPVARAMGVKVILLPFFGKGALETQAEKDRVGDVLREVAPAAAKAGVILGLEDTISARDNVAIMERAKSPAVLDLLRRRQLDQGRLRRRRGDSLAGRGTHLRRCTSRTTRTTSARARSTSRPSWMRWPTSGSRSGRSWKRSAPPAPSRRTWRRTSPTSAA